MSDFLRYQQAIAKRELAYAHYNCAAQTLKNASIHERLAEIKSQSEPIDGLLREPLLSYREKLYAAAFYVVTGRLPEAKKNTEIPSTTVGGR